MTLFDEIAANYSIADRTFTLKLSGAEILALISLVQVAAVTAPAGMFERAYPEAINIAKGVIEVVSEVDPAAGAQLQSGWDLGKIT